MLYSDDRFDDGPTKENYKTDGTVWLQNIEWNSEKTHSFDSFSKNCVLWSISEIGE